MGRSTDKIDNAKAVIDEQTSEYLGTYCREAIKDKLEAASQEEGATPNTIADSVYDFIHGNFCGSCTLACLCNTIMPKSNLTYLRTDIIKALS